VGRAIATLGGVLVLALLAGGLTEATLAIGHSGGIADDYLLRPASSHLKAAGVTPKPTPSGSPVASPAATPAATSVPSAQLFATTNAFVHMRAGKTTASNIVLNLNGGSQVQLLPDSDSQWQQVQYNGVTGYIFKTYLNF
jgi:uncharacterized protein YgiM (DUF1202 family)